MFFFTFAGCPPSPNCVFPFKYQGKTFSQCTTYQSPYGKPWCATKVDRQGNVIWDQWEDCNECSISKFSDPEAGMYVFRITEF